MFIRYMTGRGDKLKERSFLLGLFTFIPNRMTAGQTLHPKDGEIVFLNSDCKLGSARYGFYEAGKLVEIPASKNTPDAPFSIYDQIDLKPNDIVNCTEKCQTTIGRFVTNYLLLVDAVGDKVPYVNDVWKISDVESKLSKLILTGKITTEQYRRYMDNGYFLAHFGELCVPSITAKSLSTDPQVKVRREELLAKYKDTLTDPKVISAIEQELIAMDKAWLKGDPSTGFFDADPKKSWSINRKKMFLLVGGIDELADNPTISVITNPLSDGMNKNNFDAIANEIRKGSYSRGKETMYGGLLIKIIARAFQDIKLIETDCGTNEGIRIMFNDNTVSPQNFISRVVMVNDKGVEITEANWQGFLGKTVTLRSPMTCKSVNGLCYTCSGMVFKTLDIKSPGILAIEISSKFQNNSMKQMHGTVISTTKVDPFKYFV
jgi:hypothetical protein